MSTPQFVVPATIQQAWHFETHWKALWQSITSYSCQIVPRYHGLASSTLHHLASIRFKKRLGHDFQLFVDIESVRARRDGHESVIIRSECQSWSVKCAGRSQTRHVRVSEALRRRLQLQGWQCTELCPRITRPGKAKAPPHFCWWKTATSGSSPFIQLLRIWVPRAIFLLNGQPIKICGAPGTRIRSKTAHKLRFDRDER